MTKLIKFRDEAHWYAKDGKAKHDADLRVARKEFLYPSVTSVDKGCFPNPVLEQWKMNQLVLAASEHQKQPHENAEQFAQRIYDISKEKASDAAAFGKDIHDAIEKHPAAPEARLMPWFLKFDEWWSQQGLEPYERESTLLDHDIGVAGRCDLICGSKSSIVIPDWKTQDVKTYDGKKKPAYYDSWKRQLAFYAVAYAKRQGTFPEIPRCLSLIIDSNEGGLVYPKWWEPEEIKTAYNIFIHAAWIWQASRNYWPRGEWKISQVQL